MELHVKELTSEWTTLHETKDPAWLSETLAGTQGRPAPGSGLDASVEASTYGGNVFVRGSLRGNIFLLCSRCATEWLEPMTFPFDLVFAPAKGGAAEEGEKEIDAEDVSFSTYEGETIDLDPVLREQVILQVPEYPLCQADCRGLCQRCGCDLNQGKCRCAEPPEVDPRLAALKNFKPAS